MINNINNGANNCNYNNILVGIQNSIYAKMRLNSWQITNLERKQRKEKEQTDKKNRTNTKKGEEKMLEIKQRIHFTYHYSAINLVLLPQGSLATKAESVTSHPVTRGELHALRSDSSHSFVGLQVDL